MKLFLLLILTVFTSEKEENVENDRANGEGIGNNEKKLIVVKIEEDEYDKVNKRSKFIGVTYHKNSSKWRARRWSKNEKETVSNGYHDDEETAAHASDTLARKLMENGEQNHKLNFPDDHTEVYPEEKNIAFKFIGVFYHKNKSQWYVQRWSKNEKKNVCYGYYDNEETTAHASDTLAIKLMENGEQNHKLNFPENHIEIYPKEKKSKFIGVSFYENTSRSKWSVQRWNKAENKFAYYGCYDDEETAALASDTLARKLMENGERKLKLNFPENHTEVYPEEEKGSSRYIGVSYYKINSKWKVQRRSKYENKTAYSGCYDDEETAAHASDTLARQLMKNGEQKHKLNFPEDHTEVYQEENQKQKRKRPKDLNLEHP